MAHTPGTARSKTFAALILVGGFTFLLWFPGTCLKHSIAWLDAVEADTDLAASLHDASWTSLPRPQTV